MQCIKLGSSSLSILAALCLIGVSTVTVQAAKLHVANNGLDSATCGDKSTPCRSISQAIQNASNGDKIIVGPGRYGDLDADGTFGETGEEDAEVGAGCFCMIKVDKQLTIESRDGAAATVLDAGGVAVSIVTISASGVVFGKKNKGFTLTHAGFGGLLIPVGSTTGVRFTGNVASDNGFFGFQFIGSGHVLTGNLASANDDDGFLFFGSGHLLSGNSALGNKGFGILIFNSGGVDSATITKNNLFGNNNQPFTLGANTFTNCGLLNRSEDSFSLPNNFWGAATGPSATEPADNVCNSGTGSSTTVPSFSTKEFKVKVKALEEVPTETVPDFAASAPSPSEVGLGVYSLTGQLIAIVFDQTQLALTTRSLPNGIYLTVRTYADGRRELVKIRVSR